MPSSRLITAIKALRQLGFTQVALNGLYRLGLKTGYFKRVESRGLENSRTVTNHLLSIPLFSFPPKEQILQTIGADGLQALLAEADEIVAGKFRQFGAEPVEINLAPPAPLGHWTDYETHRIPITIASGFDTRGALLNLREQLLDPKMLWEPARFGWAFVLGRAWHVTGDEQYAVAFWRYFESFQIANPPYQGPNWMSGQEVGIRLMAFVWAAQVFADAKSSTSERLRLLAGSITQHALRIPPTLIYARSQNNNHLLTEAAALYTASLALPDHPRAPQWQSLGQTWLTWCFTHQIDAYGEYVQHSTNYHRLMLQTALWVSGIRCQVSGLSLTPDTSHPTPFVRENLTLATHWLLSLLDPDSGHAPNLGANDGALSFPLSTQPFDDFRPVAQAAARAFLGYSLPSGPWDEMSLWFGLPQSENQLEIPRYPGDHLYAPHSWGYLRAVRFKSRPSHADQLHFDLWWRGLNIAQDAGTYLYNADPPWDNRLTSTLVHNTVNVDGQEQMTRAGRFLYLDWADATSKRHFETDADFSQRASARTYAYAKLGVRHDRTVTVFDDERWQVDDELLNLSFKPHTFRLHWLLPDWEWELVTSDRGLGLRLKSPQGSIGLNITFQPLNPATGSPVPAVPAQAGQALQPFDTATPLRASPSTTIVRAGEYLHGSGPVDPIRGWVSPTYAQKVPALSLAIEVESAGNLTFTSEFTFST